MKKKAIVCGMISVLVAAVMVLLIGWGDAIFQCGNPSYMGFVLRRKKTRFFKDKKISV